MGTVLVRTSMIVGLTVISAGLASAQTAVALPDSSQTTLLTAAVSEQAQVTVPVGVTFNVTNVALATASGPASVTAAGIVMSSASKTLKIWLKGNGPVFTPSVAATPTWVVADVSWNAATFSNGGTGVVGTLAETYTAVVTCAANVASCSTTNLVFTLAAKPAITRAGDHTYTMTWKFESIGA